MRTDIVTIIEEREQKPTGPHMKWIRMWLPATIKSQYNAGGEAGGKQLSTEDFSCGILKRIFDGETMELETMFNKLMQLTANCDERCEGKKTRSCMGYNHS